jgi:hypothetical protein
MLVLLADAHEVDDEHRALNLHEESYPIEAER